MNNQELIMYYLQSHQSAVYAKGNFLEWWIEDDNNLSPVCMAIITVSIHQVLIQTYLDRKSLDDLGQADKYANSQHFPGGKPLAQKVWDWKDITLSDITTFLERVKP